MVGGRKKIVENRKKKDTKELEVNQQTPMDNAESYTRSKVNVVYIGKRWTEKNIGYLIFLYFLNVF